MTHLLICLPDTDGPITHEIRGMFLSLGVVGGDGARISGVIGSVLAGVLRVSVTSVVGPGCGGVSV